MLASAVSRLSAFAKLTEADFEDLAEMASGRRSLNKGAVIGREGDEVDGLFLLLKGWVTSSITFSDGSEQLLNVHVPGDVLGNPDLAVQLRSQSMVALTPVELAVIPEAQVGRLFEKNPRLAFLLFLISQEERVTLMDRLASIGATEAPARLASLILHIHSRVRRSDPETGDSFAVPLSQQQIGALLGLSQIHLNRTLQKLRSDGLVTWAKNRVKIIDRSGLISLSGLPRRSLRHEANWLPRSRAPGPKPQLG